MSCTDTVEIILSDTSAGPKIWPSSDKKWWPWSELPSVCQLCFLRSASSKHRLFLQRIHLTLCLFQVGYNVLAEGLPSHLDHQHQQHQHHQHHSHHHHGEMLLWSVGCWRVEVWSRRGGQIGSIWLMVLYKHHHFHHHHHHITAMYIVNCGNSNGYWMGQIFSLAIRAVFD